MENNRCPDCRWPRHQCLCPDASAPGQLATPGQSKQMLVIVIEYCPEDGTFEIEAPIEHEMHCLAMLEMGKVTVTENMLKRKRNTPQITGPLGPFNRNRDVPGAGN